MSVGSDHSRDVKSFSKKKYFRNFGKFPKSRQNFQNFFLPINSIYPYKDIDTLLKSIGYVCETQCCAKVWRCENQDFARAPPLNDCFYTLALFGSNTHFCIFFDLENSASKLENPPYRQHRLVAIWHVSVAGYFVKARIWKSNSI